MLSPTRLAIVLAVTVSPALMAAEPASSCRVPAPWLDEIGEGSDFDAPITVEADRSELLPDSVSKLSGDVTVSQPGRRIRADEVTYDAEAGRIDAEGVVEYADRRVLLRGRQASYEVDDGSGSFTEAEFELAESNARGSARVASTGRDGITRLEAVSYSTCAADDETWRLDAPEIELDHERGRGVARAVKLELGGIPVFYMPYLSFPIDDQRKSGILTPDFGRSDRRGSELRVPIYWNIAPNMDATFTPRYMSKRGLQLGTEYRYLTERHRGQLDAAFLADDRMTGEDRGHYRFRHDALIDPRWSAHVDMAHVSDSDYFVDLSDSLSRVSVTHLERDARLLYLDEGFSFLAQLQNFQTVDQTIAAVNRPYARRPRLLLAGQQRMATRARIDWHAELVDFDRDVGVTGSRLDLHPVLSWPIAGRGWRLTPEAGLRYTRYQLQDLAPGAEDRIDRSVPSFALDGRLLLYRDAGADGRILHSVEPRFRYSYIGYRDQTGLPVFDTGRPDLNSIQLFRSDRYVGPDRVGDTDQLAVGITTRLEDTETGLTRLSATVGQIFYFTDQRVTLPGEVPVTAGSSDVLVELDTDLDRNWSMGLDLQYDPRGERADKGVLSARYREGRRIVNMAYRFRRGKLEQTDMSLLWPVNDRLAFVARWNYDLDTSTTLERFAGIEYESCCWAVRLINREYIVPNTNQKDDMIMIQLELKGLTSLGGDAGDFLERGILGYSDTP